METKHDICETNCIHEDTVRKVYENMPIEEDVYELADFFKIFSDSTRLNILSALDESELCVCDLATILGMSQSAISHQLRILKQTRLVKNRRDGKVVYYSLNDDHIKDIIKAGFEHIKE